VGNPWPTMHKRRSTTGASIGFRSRTRHKDRLYFVVQSPELSDAPEILGTTRLNQLITTAAPFIRREGEPVPLVKSRRECAPVGEIQQQEDNCN